MLQHFGPQVINLLAAVLLLLAFAMLSQRRILSLINLFAAQGFVLFLSTALVAALTDQKHLYVSAAVTLVLKVTLLPAAPSPCAVTIPSIRWSTVAISSFGVTLPSTSYFSALLN